jgi:hypothetical protein
LRSLFFVALDEHDLSVKRMQSFFTVQPGETVGCAGCHEHRTEAVRPRPMARAIAKRPARIEPIRDVPDVLDFTRDIQPILNRRCFSCHSPQKPEGGVVLSDEMKGWFSQSYSLLMEPGRKLIAHGQDAHGNRPPRSIGTSASRLLRLIDGSHEKVEVTALEKKTIMLWIESGAPCAGTYAALGMKANRFDAASGFRPNEHYVREMKRYGILPDTFDPAKDPIDCYSVDQAYWRSFWHRGQAATQQGKDTP